MRGQRVFPRIGALVVAAVLLGVLLPETPAVAADVSVNGGKLVYAAAPGEQNALTVSAVSVSGQQPLIDLSQGPPFDGSQKGFVVTFADAGANIAAGSGCAGGGGLPAGCQVEGHPSIEITTLDGDDSVDTTGITGDWFQSLEVAGGEGEDTLKDGPAGTWDPWVYPVRDGRVFLDGGDGSDLVDGGGGGDLLDGGNGADKIDGGPGSDDVSGGRGADTLLLRDGEADYLPCSSTQADHMELDVGLDGSFSSHCGEFFSPYECDNEITGTTGSDRLNGTAGSDYIDAQAGDDILKGLTGADCVDAGPGNDVATVSTTDRSDSWGWPAFTIDGGGGEDQIRGGPSIDELYGGSGADAIDGRGEADRIYGGTGKDRLEGGGGSDYLHGDGGNDSIYVADGVRDEVDCGDGRDWVAADRKDRLVGCEQVHRRR
ncbi:MAG: hypothetical protein QOJ38_1414 [Solirubrobacterales bacterium]|jgi:Ca2+-binding RTX toxin-like protein|nr:hypothetical protein [Solirubrobacterales bacterium]